MVSLSALLAHVLVLCVLGAQAQLPARNVVRIVSAVGLATTAAAEPDVHDFAGCLRGDLSSNEGVSVFTDPTPVFNLDQYESYLWYVYQDRDPATDAELYRLYFAPTLNETALFGHFDDNPKSPLVSIPVNSNLPTISPTTFTWNITLTEFHSYPPFGLPGRYYQIRSSINNNMVLTLLQNESRVALAPLVEPFTKADVDLDF
ncbi:hypothetical protein R3P38DRAFT_3120100 [Favolaschia claudopus]|uniref:Uncharacterized protein n=1 Tax=Favolaschia claudopus TaxID=2862362 RepID=A0AAV9ZE91_9AGAR